MHHLTIEVFAIWHFVATQRHKIYACTHTGERAHELVWMCARASETGRDRERERHSRKALRVRPASATSRGLEPTKPWCSTFKRALCTLKTALYTLKTALYTLNIAQCTLKTALRALRLPSHLHPTRTLSLSYTHSLSPPLSPHTYAHACTHLHICTHAHMHTHTHTHACARAPTRTRTRAHTRAHVHTHTHIHTLKRVCEHTRTRIHTHKQTHFHTHKHLPSVRHEWWKAQLECHRQLWIASCSSKLVLLLSLPSMHTNKLLWVCICTCTCKKKSKASAHKDKQRVKTIQILQGVETNDGMD